MSQCERLLDRLQRGPITPMEAWKDASEIDKRLDVKQYDSYGEDSCIWFHVEHAEMICLAIEKLRKEIVGG